MRNDKTISILGISGSPRIGATDYVINESLNYAKNKFNGVETDYFSVKGKKLNFCTHCDHCVREKEGCIQRDDMDELYPKLTRADVWILGSPVYQGSISAQLKAVLDRCRALTAADPKVFKNKLGGAIATAGDRVGGQEPTINIIHAFYIINEFVPLGGGSFGANLGGTVWSKDRKAQGAKEDSEGIKSVHKLVNNLIATAKYLI